MVCERLRWGEALLRIFEYVVIAILQLLPKFILVYTVRWLIAKKVYKVSTCQVFLYKSGRAALCGLLKSLKLEITERQVALIPDYTCNVVADAGLEAGFRIKEYPTDETFMPVWSTLETFVSEIDTPVLIFCSMFGSEPAADPRANALHSVNKKLFIVADECQNLVINSSVKPNANRAIVFSFNDKTCPGIMGGGVVCAAESKCKLTFERDVPSKRLKCALWLTLFGLAKVAREMRHMLRLVFCVNIKYDVPVSLEYSECRAPHYNLVSEDIYKVSVARGLISLLFLKRYAQVREENCLAFMGIARVKAPHYEREGIRAFPPFLPVQLDQAEKRKFPAPIKAPYATQWDRQSSYRRVYAIHMNIPYVRYIRNCPGPNNRSKESKGFMRTICHITSSHRATDNRILHCEAISAIRHRNECVVIGPAQENAEILGVRLITAKGLSLTTLPKLLRAIIALWVATSTRASVYHFHDPEMLLPAIVLKLTGRKVVYDVHDDYEASVKDRLRTTPWLARICSKLWWFFERNASRVFDGIIVADRHLAGKFAWKKPIILSNYPRLDFTGPTDVSLEKTFNIIYVGGVSRDRGVGKVIDALKLLPYKDIRFHIIGECRDKTLLAQINSDNRIVYFGRVFWTDLHKYYVKAHCGVACYQALSGFITVDHSVKIVEYMAAGIPVLCSDFPGLKKFVEESGYGLTVTPDDPRAIAEKIQYLYEHPDVRNELGQNGRHAFEREYNWEKHESKLIDLYERILNEKAHGSARKTI